MVVSAAWEGRGEVVRNFTQVNGGLDSYLVNTHREGG